MQFPSAIYHVMSHGDRREPMFKDDADRQRFLTTTGGSRVCLNPGRHHVCQGVFTCKDDNSFGAAISGFSGALSGYFAHLALRLDSTAEF